MAEKGNINLYSRPRVRNPDGSISTVFSMGFNEDGQEILVPRVERTGKGILSEDAAVKQYHETGEHLGKFATVDEAKAYADQLHREMESGVYDVPLATSLKSVEPDALRETLKGFLMRQHGSR